MTTSPNPPSDDRAVMLSAVLDAIRSEPSHSFGLNEEGLVVYREPLCRRIEALPPAPAHAGEEGTVWTWAPTMQQVIRCLAAVSF